MRILLHIGVWKTGSTAIQDFLNANARALAERGVIAPAFTRKPFGHNAYVKAVKAHGPHRLEALTREIARAARGRRDATVVLSSEHYWPLGRAQRVKLGAALRGLADEVRVLAYLRPQEEMWASLYAQQAKSLRVRPATPLWGRPGFVGEAIVNRGLFYGQCLTGFRRTVGREVIARRYARDAFAGGDVVSDFLSILGLSEADGLTAPAAEVNRSFGWKGVAFSVWCAERLAAEGLLKGDRTPLKKALASAVRSQARPGDDGAWLGRAPNYLDEAARAEIRAHYAADAALLSRRFFRGAPVFPPPAPRAVDPRDPADIPGAEFAAARRAFDEALRRESGLFSRPPIRLADPA